MEINDHIIEGDYENCYGSLFLNLKNEPDQRQLLEFMEKTKLKCLDIYEQRYREYEKQITTKFNNEYLAESVNMTDQLQKDLLQASKINQIYSELNQQLSEKLQASLIFGSIIYSVGDFRLKQEKVRQQYLQNKNDCYKQKISKFKKEAVCFVNMNRTKDDFILQLKNKINQLQHQFNIQSSPKEYNPPEFLSTSDSKENTPKDTGNNSGQSSSGSLKRFELENNSHMEETSQSNPEENKLIEEDVKIEQTQQLPSDFDMYNYSFGKLFKAKSLQQLEENQPQNQHSIKDEEPTTHNSNNNHSETDQQKQQQQQQSNETNNKKISNIQILKQSANIPPILNDKQPRISLFNSISDSSLSQKKKQPSPSPQNSMKKMKCVNNSPSLARMKKTNSQSLCGNYGQNFFSKTDPDLINQMIIEPPQIHQKVQSQSNTNFYNNNNAKYQIQVNPSSIYYDGQTPRSFVIHKLGSNLKSQIPANSTLQKKKI